MSKLKVAELKILGRCASSYCYNSPSKINVDITGKCNLSCVWCSRNFVKIPNIHMKKRKVLSLFRWMKDPAVVTFAGFGEPLLYPIDDLREFIKKASEKAKVRIITNGTLLQGIRAEKLGRSELYQLIVSIDSSNPDYYNRIRGTSLQQVKKNIKSFTDEYDIPVAVNAVAFEGDDSHWEQFKEETGVDKILLKPLKESEFSKKAGFKPHPEHKLNKKGHCFQPFYEFNLGVDGRFHPCCTCRTMGTTFRGFDDAWNGKWIRTFRHNLIKRNFPKYCQEWCQLS